MKQPKSLVIVALLSSALAELTENASTAAMSATRTNGIRCIRIRNPSPSVMGWTLSRDENCRVAPSIHAPQPGLICRPDHCALAYAMSRPLRAHRESGEPEQAPHRRIFEERVVEQAVHCDRGERDTADERRPADERRRDPSQGEQKRGRGEPGEQRETRKAELCGNRDRRVVRRGAARLAPVQSDLLGVRVLEVADPDAGDRMMYGDLDPGR